MVSRPVVLGVIGVVAILVALVLNFWVLPGDEADVAVAPPRAPSAPAQQGADQKSSTASQPAPASTESAAPASSEAADAGDTATPAATDEAAKPSFDIVRVDPEGNTVIAGRSQPNAEVTIMDGDKELGRVQSDDRGEWVFVPSEKLSSGERVLTLKETDQESGSTAQSDEAIVLVVPEPGKDIAGRETEEPSTPLALVVPREETGASTAAPRVLQAPTAGPATPDAGSDSDTTVAAAAPSDDSDTGAAVKAYPEPKRAPVSITADGSDVSVDVIEYDDTGEVVFGGKTEPNSEVEIFIDEKAVGRATADAEGRWQMRPSAPLAPGNYRLRVDRVDPDGKVQARVVLPFVRAAPLASLPQDRLVVIQPGNNLWRIATRVYGSGTRYIQIHDANRDQIKDPDLIYPGQIFGLPRVN